ncbi:hypothetical protein D3C80_657900 [compost metagenome]
MVEEDLPGACRISGNRPAGEVVELPFRRRIAGLRVIGQLMQDRQGFAITLLRKQ